MKSLLLLITILLSLHSTAAFNSSTNTLTYSSVPGKQQSIVSTSLTVKQLEAFLGRKLSLKEKIQWFLAKKMIELTSPDDEQLTEKARNNAYWGFGLSIAGILLLPLFAIPAIIVSNNALAYEKDHPGSLGSAKSYARAGKTMGWIGIGLLAITLLVVILILALWNGFN